MIDMLGKKFGMLTVIELAGQDKRKEYLWKCRCDCGNETIVLGGNLRSGHIKSCGCAKATGERNGNYKGGHCKDRLYHVWMTMKQRCTNPNNGKYYAYGARGITVCEEWMEFETFRTWALENGYNPNAKYGETTIDRIDVNGNYEPSNCRFTDLFVQNKNRRPFKRIKEEIA
jgi:hypothetical protein